MSGSLQLHELQHTRLPCPTPSPGVCSNSCPLSQWCHPAISYSVISFSSFPQSFPSSGSFPTSLLFVSGGHNIGASASVFLMNIQGWFPFLFHWLYLLAVKGTLKRLIQYHSSKASIRRCSAFFLIQLSHPYMTSGKTMALTVWTFVGKVMFLLFNTLSQLVIAFLPRSKHFKILWLQSPSAVILEPEKIKYVTVSSFPLSD